MAYASLKKILFRVVCILDRVLVDLGFAYDTYVAQPWRRETQKVYGGYITKIEKLDLLGMQKNTIMGINIFEKMLGLFMYYYLPRWFETYASSRLTPVFDSESLASAVASPPNDPNAVYRIWVEGFPHAFLTRGEEFEVPYTVEDAIVAHKTLSKKYILVLINGKDDVTHVFKQHCESLTDDVELTVMEFICLAFMEHNHHKYLDYLGDPRTFLVVIDDNTFEERVFTSSQICFSPP